MSDSAPTRVTDRLRPIVESLPADAQLPFIAALERGAADRYRGWADAVADPEIAEGLRACAAREEEIATRIETLAGRRADEMAGLESVWEQVRDVGVGAYGSRSLSEQLAIQADAERGGASVWRELGTAASDADRDTFEACARLEEQSAAYVEKVLADGRVRG